MAPDRTPVSSSSQGGKDRGERMGCRHVTVTTYTRRARDLFRLRHWVRCLECGLRIGPFPDLGIARLAAIAEDAEGRKGAMRHDRSVSS